MNKIWDLNRLEIVSHPSVHTKEFCSQVKSLQASYFCKVKVLAVFVICVDWHCTAKWDEFKRLYQSRYFFFFYCQETISIKLNRKLKVKMRQTVNLILPWWELINISTGTLMHYLNCTRSLGKLPFLKFSQHCHLAGRVQVHHSINALISCRGEESRSPSRLRQRSGDGGFGGSAARRAAVPATDGLRRRAPRSGTGCWPWVRRDARLPARSSPLSVLLPAEGLLSTEGEDAGRADISCKSLERGTGTSLCLSCFLPWKTRFPDLMVEEVEYWQGWLRRPSEACWFLVCFLLRVGCSCPQTGSASQERHPSVIQKELFINGRKWNKWRIMSHVKEKLTLINHWLAQCSHH